MVSVKRTDADREPSGFLRASKGWLADGSLPALAVPFKQDAAPAGEREGHALLAGWRAEMVGNELVELLEGRIELRLDDGELVVSKRP